MLLGFKRHRVPLVDERRNPFLDRVQADSLISRHWTIIGPGSIGDKAGDLLAKTRSGLKAGFQANERNVLAMGFFDAFYARNKIMGNEGEQGGRIISGEFSAGEKETMRRISEKFKGMGVAVRSSAHGDCQGVGIYESRFVVEVTPETVERAIKEVLASHWTDDAIEYRRVSGLPEGMAVIIEPIIGILGYEGFAPNYSGIAHTSLPDKKSRIRVVAGLPTSVVQSAYGIKVTYSQGNIFAPYLAGLNVDVPTHMLPRETLEMLCGETTSLYGEINTKGDVKKLLNNLRQFFEKLIKFEKLCGRPQYIEWAGIFKNENLQVTILQTADIKGGLDYIDIPKDPEKILMRCNYAVGTGIVEFPELVVIRGEGAVKALHQYNKEHKGYVVAYDAKLHSGDDPLLTFSDLSNAAVVVEFGEGHLANPASHWEGLMEATKKIFLATKLSDEALQGALVNLWRDGKSKKINSSGEVYTAKFRVTACARQQDAVIEVLG